MVVIDGRPAVWVLLVERGITDGSDVQLFWHESVAIGAACDHLTSVWSAEELATTADVLEAIEAANQRVGPEEYITLAPFPVDGNQYFEGETDERSRCQACQEPIELDDPNDSASWIHCEDANDLGDHTAEA